MASVGLEYRQPDDKLLTQSTTSISTIIGAGEYITSSNNNNNSISEICDKVINNNETSEQFYEHSRLIDLNEPQIIQNDEILTVVVSEASNNIKNLEFSISEPKLIETDKSTSNGIVKTASAVDESNKTFPKSILAHSDSVDRKGLLRKKSVSFEADDDLKKFLDGEEIVDKKNPFRLPNGDVDAYEKYRIVKVKKSSIPIKVASSSVASSTSLSIPSNAPLALPEESDFITKDDILKQSKYVPVYIKNPDKVLQYDRSVLERLSISDTRSPTTQPSSSAKRTPVPIPRKTKPETTVKKVKEKRKTRSISSSGAKYPDLSDIKVKTGTDLDKSLYDPNEVVLNAKKFDSRFKKIAFGSTDDIDEIADLSLDEKHQNGHAKTTDGQTDDPVNGEEKKSYTNTVNSEEFREYLKKKGLLLFPIKTNGTTPAAASNGVSKPTNGSLKAIDEVDSEMDKIDRKKSVFSRLSSIFKGKTTPKDGPAVRTFSNKNEDNRGSNIKRVILERSSFHGGDNRAISANNEFTRQFSSRDLPAKRLSKDDDHSQKSSISSVLTAAADDYDEVQNTPVVERKNESYDVARRTNPDGAKTEAMSLYRNIDLNRSKLYQSKVKQNNIIQQQNGKPPSFDNISQLSDDVIKPRVQRPSSNLSRVQPVNKSLIKPPVPIRRSIERQSMPIVKSGERYKMPNGNGRQALYYTVDVNKTPTNGRRDEPKGTSTPKDDKDKTIKSPEMSPISRIQGPDVDPFTFAKIHEIKKKTDEVFMNKSTQPYVRPDVQKLHHILQQKMTPPKADTNGGFNRNSPQRSTITEMYQNRLQRIPQHNTIVTDDDYGYANHRIVNIQQSQAQQQQPQRSQSVLDNMTCFKNSLYGEVNLRTPNVGNVNVIMRRPDSTTLDKRQIMQKIYEYYRKSVNNTPVPFEQKNLQAKSQSNDTSPVSYASVNTSRSTLPKALSRGQMQDRSSDVRNYFYAKPNDPPTCKTTISESDDVFLPDGMPQKETHVPIRYVVVNSEQLTPADVLKFQQQSQLEQRKMSYDPNRIYDVVYGSTATASRSNGTYGQLKMPQPKVVQRPASAMGYSNAPAPVYYRQQFANGRSTPLILSQQPQSLTSQMDIIYNNQIYRPVSALPKNMTPQRQRPAAPQLQAFQQNGTTTRSELYASPLRKRSEHYESESGSEAGEVQRIMQNYANRNYEEDYQNDKSSRNQQNEQVVDDRSRRSSGRREDPRRHTLGNEMLHYANQGGSLQRSMDLEMGQNPQKSRKGVPIRAYTPQHQGPLFDDDPGIMSEVETASTGFRRGGKQRSSLPVVRTPSKTLERPLGLVFLQYRSETKRALLPNEITSIDTVRALFVRSFPRQLSMAYLEGPNVKIYIHDSSKDMFYELEDVRSHLREIRDRSVLRLFESNEVAAPQALPGGPGIPQPLPQQGGHWDQDQSYFSEPEFDSEYQHQHIHKSKTGKAPYYVGAAQTLPRGHIYTDRSKNSIGVPAKPLRSYGSRGNMGPQFPYPSDQLYSIPDGYMSSPERGTRAYEEPYYTQYGTRGGSVTAIIDEEQNDPTLIEDQYSMYGVKVPNRISRNPNQMYDPSRPEDLHRIRVEHMERQLANLTGLVQKALVQNPQVNPTTTSQPYLGVPGQYRTDKSVSFEKSVSFSDDIQGVPKSHSPQHLADTKPTKPAIKSSTLPRTSSQERDRLKPAPPLKQTSISNQYRPDLALAPEVYNHLRGLQKKAKDLRTEVRTLRRIAQTQAVAVREDIKDTFMRIRATLLATSGSQWGQGDQERTRISREEEIYKQEVIRLEKDLADLEGSVEVLRGEVINRRTRVNMAAVEDMALVLSRASKTVAELKMRFPGLQQNLHNILSTEMERVCREEKFLKEEPDRLEIALRRCKKLTGTLVTLKRLASVQEQRTCVDPVPTEEQQPRSASETTSSTNKPVPSPRLGGPQASGIAPENALDALLDELQTFAKPPMGIESRPDESTTSDDSSQTLQNTVTTKLSQSQLYPEPMPQQVHGLRRLASYPSGSDTDTQDQTSPPRPTGKPPVPERNAELLSRYGKKIPPPPPPRTSSRSPLASPTSPNLPPRLPAVAEQLQQHEQHHINNINNNHQYPHNLHQDQDSGSESANSQDNNSQRQMQLELRHQELLKKQKQLQEQYQRLQQMSKNSIPLAPNDGIKKTGSESNLSQKMGLSGSLKNLSANENVSSDNVAQPQTTVTTNKVYETEIL